MQWISNFGIGFGRFFMLLVLVRLVYLCANCAFFAGVAVFRWNSDFPAGVELNVDGIMA